MSDVFHYPPDLLNLLVDTIPALCRSKKDVVLFFEGSGVDPTDLADVSKSVRLDPQSISKAEIARQVLSNVNHRADSGLRPRREIVKRVVEFSEFGSCWPNDQMKARGLVASVRELVNAKDTFTRINLEREAERADQLARRAQARETALNRKRELTQIGTRLAALFSQGDEPQKRGLELEAVLNALFRTYGVLIRENFKRRDPDSNHVLEQIDGVIVTCPL